MPPQASANNLVLPDTPPELCDLTTLEERLLSQRYPFIKLLALPKGRQSRIKGAVLNVPVHAKQVCDTLPKTPNEAGFIPLKLKRKLKYSGHHTFQYIRPNIVRNAFKWLKENNPLYHNANEREAWEDACKQEDEEVWKELTHTDISESVQGNVCELSVNSPEVQASPNNDAIQSSDHEQAYELKTKSASPNFSAKQHRCISDFAQEPIPKSHGIADTA